MKAATEPGCLGDVPSPGDRLRAHPPAGTTGAGARRPGCRPGRGRGDRPPRRPRRRPDRADGRRRPGPRRRPRRRRPPGRRHLLPQGLHPAHPPVPGPLPLLHVRHGAGQAGRRGQGAVPLPRRGPGHRRRRRAARLHRGAVHPRRPARGPLARGPAVARRARLRLDARLRARDGDPGAGGDRAAAAPQPRRHVVGGAQPAQAGLPVDGHDARDHLDAAVHREGPAALRLPRQGPRRPAAGARGRRPALGPVHHRHSRRHRRDARPSGRSRSSRSARVAQQHGHVQEVIVQNFRAKPDTAMRSADDLGLDEYLAAIAVARLRPRPQDAGPGPAEPRRPRRVPRAARRRRRRLGRRLPADPRPREPRAALALPRPAPRRSPPTAGLHPARAADRAPRVRPRRRALDRPPRPRPRRRTRRRRRPRPPRRTPRRACPGRSPTAASTSARAPAAPTCTPRSTPTAGPPTAAATSTTSTATGTSCASRLGPPQGHRRTTRRARRPDDAPPRAWMGLAPWSDGARWLPAAGAATDRRRRRAPAGRERPQAASPTRRRSPCSPPTAPTSTRYAGSPTATARTSVGDDVTYVVNRNINFTNVCYTGCRFCAFAQRRTDADAYSLSLDQVADRAEEAWQLGATEVCMQGGIDPELPGHGVLRPRRGGEGAGPGHARARVLARWRSSTAPRAPGCPSATGWPRRRRPGSTRSPGRRRRSSTTTSGGSSPRASCRPARGSRWSRPRTSWGSGAARR